MALTISRDRSSRTVSSSDAPAVPDSSVSKAALPVSSAPIVSIEDTFAKFVQGYEQHLKRYPLLAPQRVINEGVKRFGVGFLLWLGEMAWKAANTSAIAPTLDSAESYLPSGKIGDGVKGALGFTRSATTPLSLVFGAWMKTSNAARALFAWMSAASLPGDFSSGLEAFRKGDTRTGVERLMDATFRARYLFQVHGQGGAVPPFSSQKLLPEAEPPPIILSRSPINKPLPDGSSIPQYELVLNPKTSLSLGSRRPSTPSVNTQGNNGETAARYSLPQTRVTPPLPANSPPSRTPHAPVQPQPIRIEANFGGKEVFQGRESSGSSQLPLTRWVYYDDKTVRQVTVQVTPMTPSDAVGLAGDDIGVVGFREGVNRQASSPKNSVSDADMRMTMLRRTRPNEAFVRVRNPEGVELIITDPLLPPGSDRNQRGAVYDYMVDSFGSEAADNVIKPLQPGRSRVSRVMVIDQWTGNTISELNPGDDGRVMPGGRTDNEMVGSMIMAITESVGDKLPLGYRILEIAMGPTTVRIEDLANARIVMVVEGDPPSSLPGEMRALLRDVGPALAGRLEQYDRDGILDSFDYLQGRLGRLAAHGTDGGVPVRSDFALPDAPSNSGIGRLQAERAAFIFEQLEQVPGGTPPGEIACYLRLFYDKDPVEVPTFLKFQREANERIDKEFYAWAAEQTQSAQVIRMAHDKFARHVLGAGTLGEFEDRLANGPSVIGSGAGADISSGSTEKQ